MIIAFRVEKNIFGFIIPHQNCVLFRCQRMISIYTFLKKILTCYVDFDLFYRITESII